MGQIYRRKRLVPAAVLLLAFGGGAVIGSVAIDSTATSQDAPVITGKSVNPAECGKRDVILVIDRSNSMRWPAKDQNNDVIKDDEGNTVHVQDLVQRGLKKFVENGLASQDRIGMVEYPSGPKTDDSDDQRARKPATMLAFPSKTQESIPIIEEGIHGYDGTSSPHVPGLKKGAAMFGSNDPRPDVPNILVLVTDAYISEDDTFEQRMNDELLADGYGPYADEKNRETAVTFGDTIRSQGVDKIFVIGYGNDQCTNAVGSTCQNMLQEFEAMLSDDARYLDARSHEDIPQKFNALSSRICRSGGGGERPC